MAKFKPGEPIVTEEPFILVDAGLKPGRYVFQLVVVDDEGNESAPDRVQIVVSDRQSVTPTIIVDPTLPTRPTRPIIDTPTPGR
ncbi:MAG: hypothetical protein KF716_07325 [Anaerolineae bacterium]|nr:hypothetical protein [Anaerolineae bacterium]